MVGDYINHLKEDIVPKNGGFVNSKPMIQSLFNSIKFRFDSISQKNFDLVSEDFVQLFKE